MTPVAAVSFLPPTGEGSHETHTCPSIGSAALRSQELVHRAVRHVLATLTIVALFVGGSTAAASARDNTASSLRAQVDAIGARYMAAQEQSRALDSELHALDEKLHTARANTARLLPQARAHAVQLYQAGTSGFAALFDAASAMESARHAELIARASEHTQALLDQYANAAAILRSEREHVAVARAAQHRVVAALAKAEVSLEQALAQAQAAYRDQLTAQARARTEAAAGTRRDASAPTTVAPPQTTSPAPPAAPVQVKPPAPPAGTNPHHNDPFLVCTRTRESAGDYTAVNPGGYYGAYQFSAPTWDLTASHAGRPQLIGVRPDQASAWDQDQLAWVLYQWRGNAPWGGLC